MLLIFSTALLSLCVKRAYIIILFALLSHIALAIAVHYLGTTSDVSGVMLSFIASLALGLVLRLWKWWYVHNRIEYKWLKRLRTIFAIAVVLLASLNIALVYYGIKQGHALVALVRSKVVERNIEAELIDVTPSEAPKTAKKVFNSNFWLMDEATSVTNYAYDIALIVTIESNTIDEKNFNPNNLHALFDDIPSYFHPDLFHTRSATEALSKRIRILQYIYFKDKLTYSKASGKVSLIIAHMINV